MCSYESWNSEKFSYFRCFLSSTRIVKIQGVVPLLKKIKKIYKMWWTRKGRDDIIGRIDYFLGIFAKGAARK